MQVARLWAGCGFMGFAVVLAACSPQVVSPPASPLVLESAQRMPEDRVAARGMFGGYAGTFGGGARTGTLGVRAGVTEDVELSADVSAYRVENDDSITVTPPISLWGGAARLGATWQQVSTDFLVPTLGLGGGYSGLGGFFSPDLGFILAYENPYVVPLLQARGGVSIPIDPRTIQFSGEVEKSGSPELTYMALVTVGAELPLWRAAYAPALSGAVTSMWLVDAHDDLSWFGVNVGLEVPLWDGTEP